MLWQEENGLKNEQKKYLTMWKKITMRKYCQNYHLSYYKKKKNRRVQEENALKISNMSSYKKKMVLKNSKKGWYKIKLKLPSTKWAKSTTYTISLHVCIKSNIFSTFLIINCTKLKQECHKCDKSVSPIFVTSLGRKKGQSKQL